MAEGPDRVERFEDLAKEQARIARLSRARDSVAGVFWRCAALAAKKSGVAAAAKVAEALTSEQVVGAGYAVVGRAYASDMLADLGRGMKEGKRQDYLRAARDMLKGDDGLVHDDLKGRYSDIYVELKDANKLVKAF